MVKNKTQSKQAVIPKRAEANAPENTPTTEVTTLALPDAFKTHDSKLSPIGLALAIEVGRKNPAIVQAVQEFRDQYGRLGEKYFGMCKALREAKLARKESTALLLGLGLAKSRVSEILSVSEVSDVVWERYDQKQIGFKAALKSQVIEDKQLPIPGVPTAEQPKQEVHKARVVIKEFSDHNKAVINVMLKALARPLHGVNTTEWAYAAVIDDVRYYVALTVSPK